MLKKKPFVLFIYKYVRFALQHNIFFTIFVRVLWHDTSLKQQERFAISNTTRRKAKLDTSKYKTQHVEMRNSTRRNAKLNTSKLATTAVMFFIATVCLGQQPWKLQLTSPEEKVNLKLDLYEESIEVPGFESFGPMNGYMDGNIYGVWYVVGFDIKSDKQAVITIANELGSEDQKLTLTQNSDSTYQLKFLGYNAVKRAQGKKLVKIPSELKMEKKR